MAWFFHKSSCILEDYKRVTNYLTNISTDITTQKIWRQYYTYLYPYSSDAAGNDKLDETTVNAKAADFWISGGEVNGGEVTAIDQLIEDLNEEQTNFVKGVYTIDGVKVSSINSLEGLAPGVYIMGGKKYTVK